MALRESWISRAVVTGRSNPLAPTAGADVSEPAGEEPQRVASEFTNQPGDEEPRLGNLEPNVRRSLWSGKGWTDRPEKCGPAPARMTPPILRRCSPRSKRSGGVREWPRGPILLKSLRQVLADRGELVQRRRQ